MVLLLKVFFNTYNQIFGENKDPRVNYPLTTSPLPVFAIILSYLYFVNNLGPRWMKGRDPFVLKGIIKIYNFVQIVFNLYIASAALWYSYLQKDFSLKCQKLDYTDTSPKMKELIFLTYLYYLSKIADLMDTVFYVLRKKNKQITFLHVYHHAGMVFGTYIHSKFLSGGHSTLLGIINSFVHTTMYLYYFLTSMSTENGKYIWWKRYITQVQLVQFGILIVHYALPLVLFDCAYPKIILFIGMSQNIFMFLLFSDFYIKAYIKKKVK